MQTPLRRAFGVPGGFAEANEAVCCPASMGFMDKARATAEQKSNTFGSVRIYGGKVFNDKTIEGGPIEGAHATVETSGQLEKRVTATRLIMTGPFALALRKKKDNRELFLTVEGPTFAFVVEVDPKKQAEARKFAAKINTAARA